MNEKPKKRKKRLTHKKRRKSPTHQQKFIKFKKSKKLNINVKDFPLESK